MTISQTNWKKNLVYLVNLFYETGPWAVELFILNGAMHTFHKQIMAADANKFYKNY